MAQAEAALGGGALARLEARPTARSSTSWSGSGRRAARCAWGATWRRAGRDRAVTRIVAGSARGRRLEVPPGQGTRPTSEKVRAAVFNRAGASSSRAGRSSTSTRAPGRWRWRRCRRGCERAACVEADRGPPRCCAATSETLGFAGRVDAGWAAPPTSWPGPPPAFALAFVDPPYEEGPGDGLALAGPLLLPGGRAIAEHDARRHRPGGSAPGAGRVAPLW